MDPKSTKPSEEAIEVSADALDEFVHRIDASGLSAADKKLIKSLVSTIVTLRTVLERRKGRLMTILRKIFGLKTETRAKSGRRPSDDTKNKNAGSGDKKKGGQGRNGKDDYPGAKKVPVKHDCLTSDDVCPACRETKLSKVKDGVAYRWTGQTPLTLTIYQLERFLCQTCKATFTATIPGEKRETSGLDPSVSPLAGGIKERAFDPSAAAQIASLRFEMGVPHFRLAEIQGQQGVPLAPSTQYKVMDDAFRKPGTAVFGELERQAGADGKLFINDDTRARVMDLEQAVKKAKIDAEKLLSQAQGPPGGTIPAGKGKKSPRKGDKSEKEDEPSRQKVQTTAIVTHIGEQKVALYYTGHKVAGENLALVLAHRSEGAPVPQQMCDGHSENYAPGFVTLMGNCLDHSRRKYNDVESSFPEEVAFVLDTLGMVYKNDKDAKTQDLSPEEWLFWHQTHSQPLMDSLEQWARSGLAEKRIEPNSTLGGAVAYMLKRWVKLTAFLREPGMPLSSAEVERLIKRCIRHRKNSLHYKTQRGAELGDMLMSLVQTCRYARQGAHAYLTAIARFAEAVTKSPQEWLPWNYQATLAQICAT